MRQITNITSENFQRHTILFEEDEIVLHLKYYTMLRQWFFDVEYKEFKLFGKHLAVGTYHMLASNQPFDFLVFDTSQNGLDPFRADDFQSGRTVLLMLEPDDLIRKRGRSVPI